MEVCRMTNGSLGHRQDFRDFKFNIQWYFNININSLSDIIVFVSECNVILLKPIGIGRVSLMVECIGKNIPTHF